MSNNAEQTCWTLIEAAAEGSTPGREEFVRRYENIVKRYLQARWRQTPLSHEVDDHAQEVFVACFRDGGALGRIDRDRPTGFRAFLLGVVRNVALQAERTHARRVQRVDVAASGSELDRMQVDEPTLSRLFDREYARAVMREARATMTMRAATNGLSAVRRVELLRLRFEDDLPIREIAKLWNEDAAKLHREYQKASREFRAALAETVAATERCAPEQLHRECSVLLGLLAG